MPYMECDPDVCSALRNGAFNYLSNYGNGTWDRPAAMANLVARYGISPRGARAILDRYDANIVAARSLRHHWRTNPLTREQHVGMVDIPQAFQYQVTVSFYDSTNGLQYSTLLTINSQVSLAPNQICGGAYLTRAVIAYQANYRQGTPRRGVNYPYYVAGSCRIVGAFTTVYERPR